MHRLIRSALVLGVTCFWAAMWGTQLRDHLIIGSAPVAKPDYGALLRSEETERHETWRIYFSSFNVGKVDVDYRRQGDGSIRSTARMTVEPRVSVALGFAEGLSLQFTADLSPFSGLRSFEVFVGPHDPEAPCLAALQGEVHGDTIHVTGLIGSQKIDKTLPYAGDSVGVTALSPTTATPSLDGPLGERWRVGVVDPLSGDISYIEVSVVERKRVAVWREDRLELVHKLCYIRGSSSWYGWVDDQGQALVQGTPFGVVLRREDLPAETVAALDVGPGSGPR